MDMVNFNKSLAGAQKKRNENKLYMKSELNLAMKHREQMKEVDRVNKVYIEEQQKEGPPMMREIDYNQQRIEQKTKMVNMLQG